MKDTQITAFKSIRDSKTPYYISLENSIKRIQTGVSKELIDKIRNTDQKEDRNVLKACLPSICYGGVFSERNKNSLKEHSGLMITDFDGIPTQKDFDKAWKQLTTNPHSVFVFLSPSSGAKGTYGIKALISIPKCTHQDHTKYFKAFNDKFKIPYWDNSNSDVSRVCYESYDPNCYVNYKAKVFAPTLRDEGFDIKDRVPLIPVTDEDKIIDKIMSFDWKKDFIEGERNNFVFDLGGAFCEYGISEDYAIGYIQNNVAYGNFKESEVSNTIKSAYKRRSFGSKYFEDYNKQNAIKTNLKKGKAKVIDQYKIEEEVYDRLKYEAEVDNFWDVDDKNKIKANPLKYKRFLERNGFKKYFPADSLKPSWVFIESNKVSEVSPERIKDFVLNYLNEKNEFDVWNYCANYQNLFSESFLLMLESIELSMIRDTKEKSFIAYSNGILEVTKDKIKLLDYIDVDAYIWKAQIIDRDFEITKEVGNNYKLFISNISQDSSDPIECVLGYLLSRYKNKMNNKAIILNDEVISENPEGGTGKGLFVQGIRQMRKVSILDGKTFDDKKSFPYQTVSQDTDILVFDDVKKNWDFESKFSLVTEGMTLERKNKDAIKLSVEESPKMLVSTNYAIKGEGNSHDRRRHEIEIAQYYGKNLTPYDEFGHQLFDDWNKVTFNKFDNYMVGCLQKYLQKGLIPQKAKNLTMRKFIAETCMEFHEFMSDEDNFPLNKRNDKAVIFNSFVQEYKDYEKYLSRKRFHIWVSKYAGFIKADFDSGNTNGLKWFEINNGGETQNDEVPY
jgi:transcriptional regulator NrdR family protein